jgi:hypothetical protein
MIKDLRAKAVAILSAALIGLPALAAPAVRLDVSGLSKMRVCSYNYLLRIPVENVGNEPLVIEKVRAACSSCSNVSIGKDVLQPREKTELLLRGKQKDPGSFTAHAFLVTNDPANPERDVKLELTYSRDYAVEFGWEGSTARVRYPFQSGLTLEPCPASRAGKLRAKVTALTDNPIHKVECVSEHFGRVSASSDGMSVDLELPSTLSTPGVYYDYLCFTINDTDLVTVPVQPIIEGPFHVAEHMISFSYVPEGTVVEKEIQIAFDSEKDVWGRFEIRPPEGMERALTVKEVNRDGPRAAVILAIDTGLLGEKGIKTIPVTLVGEKPEERAFLTVYGSVY